MGFHLAIVTVCFFCYCFNVGFYQLWHSCKISVVRSWGQIWVVPCYQVCLVHGKRQHAHTRASLHRVEMPSPSLHLTCLLRPSIVGFVCPDIIISGDPHGAGDTERAPGNTFIPLLYTKTSFDSHGGCFSKPNAVWPGFLLEMLPTRRWITVGRLSVCLCSPETVVLNCLFGSFRAKCLRKIEHSIGRQNWVHTWLGQVLTAWCQAGVASSLALNFFICEMGTGGEAP